MKINSLSECYHVFNTCYFNFRLIKFEQFQFNMKAENVDLLRKYNVPGPRYTSYPTVPYWDDAPSKEEWKAIVKDSFLKHSEEGLSIYIHLPYCEQLCTFCGCNKFITKNHKVEDPYIGAVLKEWDMYVALFSSKPLIKEIHLGGGTPTFFSSENLKELINTLTSKGVVSDDAEFSIEVHPNYTSEDQLKTLHEIGFNRISLGIQDFDPKVQTAINRVQTYEEVERVHRLALELGFDSVNYDLIYGLPFQTKKSIQDTFDLVSGLKPNRIAYYSYAHVPWVSKVQRLFTDMDLPSGSEKRELYELGRELLEEHGYLEVGMDHFSLPTDKLYIGFEEKTLHRNFMGYTSNSTKMLIGLGVSSISDVWYAYGQNDKSIRQYLAQIDAGELAIFRGHKLNEEDLIIKQHILNLMRQFETTYSNSESENVALNGFEGRLVEMETDGLIERIDNGLTVTHKGRTFVRNICMALDKKLLEKKPETELFSSTI